MEVVVSNFKDGSPNKEVMTFLDTVYNIQFVLLCIHGGVVVSSFKDGSPSKEVRTFQIQYTCSLLLYVFIEVWSTTVSRMVHQTRKS